MRMRMKSMSVLLLGLGLIFSGCGGNGGGMPVVEVVPPVEPEMTVTPTPKEGLVELPEGVMLAALGAAEGLLETNDMVTIGGVTFSCPSGGSACTLTQDEDGDILSMGGMATATLVEQMVMLDEDLPSVTIPDGGAMIQPGDSIMVGMGMDEVALSCPAGGATCTVTQDEDGELTSEGGLVVVGLSPAAQQLVNDAEQLATQQQMTAAEQARIKGLTSGYCRS